MMGKELKPCPFCGGEAKLMENAPEKFVRCLECEASVGLWGLAETAINEWNTRPFENQAETQKREIVSASMLIEAILKIKAREKEYEKINRDLKQLQSDFYAHVRMIDCYLDTSIVAVLDDALFSLTGFQELATYYLFECIETWKIKDTNGKEYSWNSGEGFESAVYEMMENNNGE